MSIETSSSGGQVMAAEDLLRELARVSASGVLEVSHPDGESSHVWLREGRVYALAVPGYRPALGIRLLSGGLISPEQLSAAIAEQRRRLNDERIGEVLVRLGMVTSDVVDSFLVEQVHDQLADLLDLPLAAAVFHPGRRIRQDTIDPQAVEDLVVRARERRAQWTRVLAGVGGRGAIPRLGAQGRGNATTPLGPRDWTLLCRIDGRRDITELARVCGFTVMEAAQVVSDLTRAGLVVLPEGSAPDPAEPLAKVLEMPRSEEAPEPQQGPGWSFEGTSIGEPDPAVAVPSATPAEEHGTHEPAPPPTPAVADDPVPDASEWEWSASPLLAEFRQIAGGASEGASPEPVPAPPTEQATPPTEQATPPTEQATPPGTSAPRSHEEGTAPDGPAPTEVVVDIPPSTSESPAGSPAESGTAADEPAPDDEPEEVAPIPARAPSTEPPQPERAPLGAEEPPAKPAPDEARRPEAEADPALFMRELSSLSEQPESRGPTVTRQVVPLKEPRRKRRFWQL